MGLQKSGNVESGLKLAGNSASPAAAAAVAAVAAAEGSAARPTPIGCIEMHGCTCCVDGLAAKPPLGKELGSIEGPSGVCSPAGPLQRCYCVICVSG